MASKKRLIAFDFDALKQQNTNTTEGFLTFNDIQNKAQSEKKFVASIDCFPSDTDLFQAVGPAVNTDVDPKKIFKNISYLVENTIVKPDLSWCDPRDYYLQLAKDYVGDKYEVDVNGFDAEARTNTNYLYTTAVVPAKNKVTNEVENLFFKVEFNHAIMYDVFDKDKKFKGSMVMFDFAASPLTSMAKNTGERTNTKNTEALDIATNTLNNANLILKYVKNTTNQKIQKQIKQDPEFTDKINIIRESLENIILPRLENIVEKYRVTPARKLSTKEKDIIYKLQYVCDASKLQGNPATWIKNNYEKFVYVDV